MTATSKFFLAALLAATMPAHAARECEDPAYVPPQGQCARLPGAELFYYDTGPATKGKGEAVIFLHAASGNADAFKHNLAAFHAAGYRAIAYDRKNVGRSGNTLRDEALGRPHGTTLQDLDALANHLKLDKFHLIGVAAGGQVASQYVASQDSDRVLSMVLAATLGPPGLPENEPEMAALRTNIALPFEVFCPMSAANPAPEPLRLRAGPSVTRVNIPDVTVEHRELGSWFRAQDRAGVQDFLQIAANARHSSFDGCRLTPIGATQPGLPASSPRNPNTFAKISSLIGVRTLLLAGIGDVYYSPPAQMKLWGAHIRDAQYTQLDTGHAPQFEDPQAFNTAVVKFFAGGQQFERIKKR